MTATLTPRERELARRALGFRLVNGISFGNVYRARVGSDDLRILEGLAKRGLAEEVRVAAGKLTFRLTRAGALAALEPGETLDEEDFPG